MVRLKKAISPEDKRFAGHEVILLIDNDCFLSGTEHLDKFLYDFVKGDYDFACHHVSRHDYKGYQFEGCIAPVPDQKFGPANIYPGFVPIPHWENAYLLIRKELWDRLSEDDVSHTRKWIKAVVREKAKLGAHRAEYRATHTHFGDEWFHVGNLMNYYNKIDSGDARGFRHDSGLDMSRLGYFVAQADIYSIDIYPQTQRRNLLKIVTSHGKNHVLAAWERLTEGTCMQTWSK
jgi:hypothetical protein